MVRTHAQHIQARSSRLCSTVVLDGSAFEPCRCRRRAMDSPISVDGVRDAPPPTEVPRDGTAPPCQNHGGRTLQEIIQSLTSERNELKTRRKQVIRTLKNARRRNARLKTKTRQLSSQDLLEVLTMRGADPSRVSPPQGAGSASASPEPKEID